MINPYQAIIDLLGRHSIFYEEVEHEAVYTSEQAAAVSGMDLAAGAKSLLFKTKQDFILVVVAGNQRVNSKKLKQILGTKDLHFAKPEEVKEQMGCEVGACYPFGSIASLRTLVDNSLSKHEIISCNPGRHNVSLRLKYVDYQKLTKPETVRVT